MADGLPNAALLGQLLPASTATDAPPADAQDEGSMRVHLNTAEPFTLLAVGVQGSGKSHTMSLLLESCLLPVPGVINLAEPMCTLVLHYDVAVAWVCEAIG